MGHFPVKNENLSIYLSIYLSIFFTAMQLRVVKFNMRNVLFKLYHPTFIFTCGNCFILLILFSSPKLSKYLHLSQRVIVLVMQFPDMKRFTVSTYCVPGFGDVRLW